MKKVHFIFFLLASVLSSCVKSEDWKGKYLYEHDFGKNYSNTSMIIEYELTLEKNHCALSIDGYQTNDHIICKAVTTGDTAEIRFISYEDGKLENAFGVAKYKFDSILFSLKKSNNSIETKWVEMLPGNNLEKSGTYFLRITEKN